eukprot:UN05330
MYISVIFFNLQSISSMQYQIINFLNIAFIWYMVICTFITFTTLW